MHIFVRLLAKICAHFCAPFSQNMCTFVRFLKIFDVRIFVRLLAKTCAHLCAFLKNFDVRIFVRLLAKVCAHLSSELLATLPVG